MAAKKRRRKRKKKIEASKKLAYWAASVATLSAASSLLLSAFGRDPVGELTGTIFTACVGYLITYAGKSLGEKISRNRHGLDADGNPLPDPSGNTLNNEEAEFSPIDSTALAVLRLAQTDRRFTVFHACNSHHIYMADLIYAMRSYGFRIDIVRDEEFEAAVKEFAKTGQDSDAVSGLIAYTSHNENEIYTIDYSNRFTAQVLYRLDYKWPVTDDRYLENAIAALDRLTFFD